MHTLIHVFHLNPLCAFDYDQYLITILKASHFAAVFDTEVVFPSLSVRDPKYQRNALTSTFKILPRVGVREAKSASEPPVLLRYTL